VREVVREFNEPFARHGRHIDVLGWEERGAAPGRAQAHINANVDSLRHHDRATRA
jgi:hypothetical protein